MTLDHEAMVARGMVRILYEKTSPYPNRGGAGRYRANLLSSASDPILNDAAMRTLQVFQPFARMVNHA